MFQVVQLMTTHRIIVEVSVDMSHSFTFMSKINIPPEEEICLRISKSSVYLTD